MNNKPVAWMLKENPQIEGEVIPLYAHPAKTLTNTEIEDCYQLWRSLSGDPAKLYQVFKLKEQE